MITQHFRSLLLQPLKSIPPYPLDLYLLFKFLSPRFSPPLYESVLVQGQG